VTIRELAELIKEVVGFTGALKFDSSKPDGTPRKLLDVGVMNALGWRALDTPTASKLKEQQPRLRRGYP
jgi:GDP-L-fucose synthase